MELIQEINMISDFEAAGMKCLQNPSLISRFFSLQLHRFWKWGALFFAIFATFSSIIRKAKLVLVRFHTRKSQFEEDQSILFDFSDDDDEDDDAFSLQSSDDEVEIEDEDDGGIVDRDFRVKGGSSIFRHLGRRSCCGGAFSDFASGKGVVKLWEGLGFSLDFDEDLFGCGAESVVSNWDGGISGAGFGDFPAKVVLTAEGNGRGDGVIFGGYDTRMRRRAPALYAEWISPERVDAAGGVGKVYVRDEVNGVLTVGDVRNVMRPLESGEESNGDTWWDADAVIVD